MRLRRLFIILTSLTVLLWRGSAFGQVINAETAHKYAQFDADDSYDPFADYSEFDEAQEEEEDINFFRNGRFLTIGLLIGYRGFTSTLGSLYTGNIDYGLQLSYFFDMQFAMQFSYTTSSHAFGFTAAGVANTGTVTLQDIGIDMKYYANTQNVTKGLAKINPYVLLGISEFMRTTNVPDTSAYGSDNEMGFDLGGGVEFPLMRNKMYWGAQAEYQVVAWKDANTNLSTPAAPPPPEGKGTGIYPHGDTYTLLGLLGVNF